MGSRDAGYAALLALALIGCGRTAEPAKQAHDCAGKPEAPVDLSVRAEEIGPNRYRLIATATPRIDVEQVALVLVPSPRAEVVGGDDDLRFGATAAGSSRRSELVVDTRGAELTLSARVWLAGIAPSRVARIRVGDAPVAAGPVVRVVQLPSGAAVDEVQP